MNTFPLFLGYFVIQGLIENQAEIKDKIIKAIFAYYQDLKKDYQYRDEPEIESIGELKNFISLTTLHFLNVYKDGFAYLGWEFDCKWEEEHGLGVMTHQDRVVYTGHAQGSFTSWVAREDLKGKKIQS